MQKAKTGCNSNDQQKHETKPKSREKRVCERKSISQTRRQKQEGKKFRKKHNKQKSNKENHAKNTKLKLGRQIIKMGGRREIFI